MTERRTFTAGVYLRHNARVLLVFHKRFGLWLPLGGERQGDETPLETARRKVREEAPDATDVVFPRTPGPPGTPLGFLGYEEHDAAGKGLHMSFAFVAYAICNSGPYDPAHAAQAWFTLADVAQLASEEKVPPNVAWAAELALGFPQ